MELLTIYFQVAPVLLANRLSDSLLDVRDVPGDVFWLEGSVGGRKHRYIYVYRYICVIYVCMCLYGYIDICARVCVCVCICMCIYFIIAPIQLIKILHSSYLYSLRLYKQLLFLFFHYYFRDEPMIFTSSIRRRLGVNVSAKVSLSTAPTHAP